MKKKIGIIGGVGPQATQYIYEKIIELSQSKYGAKNNDDYPNIIIESVPVPDFISDTKKIDTAKKMLIESVINLGKAGATKICVASNTIHILLDDLKKKTNIKFISMIDLVAEKCAKNKFKKVAILGTPVLLQSKIYNKALNECDIELIIPNKKEIDIADRIIRQVLAGKKELTHKEEYITILNSFLEKGAEAIILGCTELPLTINYEALGKRIISSDEILAEGIADYYYA